MPLQKLPPNSTPLMDRHFAKRRPFHSRRRTLHTISELSVADNASPEFGPFIATRYYARPRQTGTQNWPRKDSSNFDDRTNMPFGGLQSYSSITYTPSHHPAPRRSQSFPVVDPKAPAMPYGQGWNAKRARARMQHEQAVASAARRRDPSGRRMDGVTRPGLSPSHMAKNGGGGVMHIRTYSSPQLLHPNSRSAQQNPHQGNRFTRDIPQSNPQNLHQGNRTPQCNPQNQQHQGNRTPQCNPQNQQHQGNRFTQDVVGPSSSPQNLHQGAKDVVRHSFERRPSLGSSTTTRQAGGGYEVEAENATRRESKKTSSTCPSSHDSVVGRSGSGASGESYKLQSVGPTMPAVAASHQQQQYASPTTSRYHNSNGGVGQVGRPMMPKAGSSLSSTSLPSYGAGTGMRPSARPKPQRYYSQVQKAQMECLATPTGSPQEPLRRRSPPTVSFTEAPRIMADVRSQHNSPPRMMAADARPQHSSPPRMIAADARPQHFSPPRRHGSNPHHVRSRSSVKIPHRHGSMPHMNRVVTTVDMQSPDSKRAVPPLEKRALPSRESLTKWNLEREAAKAGLEDQRKAQVEERVKRANEMEKEKEKELMLNQEASEEEEEEEKEAEHKGCLRGLFKSFGRRKS